MLQSGHSEMLILAISYTCVIVFVVTAILTVLSLIGFKVIRREKDHELLIKALILEIVAASILLFTGNIKFNQSNNLLEGCFKVTAHSGGRTYSHEYCIERGNSNCSLKHRDLGSKESNLTNFKILDCTDNEVLFEVTRDDGHFVKGRFFVENEKVKYESLSQPSVKVTVSRINR